MKVQILSKKYVTPSSPTPSHLQNLALSSFDQLGPPDYVNTIYYYSMSGTEETINNEDRSKRLQNALSETLTLFYPLGGRYIKSRLLVECNDKGAEYLEAQVNGCLSQLLRGGELDLNSLVDFVPRLFESDENPLVAVQFTMFECGGIAIAVSVTLRIGDAFSGIAFTDALATASRVGINRVRRPRFPLPSIFPQRDMSNLGDLVPRVLLEENKILIMRRFVFSATAISKLKERVVADSSANDRLELSKHQPTRLEVVAASVWRNLIKVAQAKHGQLKPSILIIQMNMRGRTKNIPIPENSFGNLATVAMAQFMPNDGNKFPPLHSLVHEIHKAVRRGLRICEKASSADELFLNVTNSFREIGVAVQNTKADVYNFTNWCRFPIYNLDFGWGKTVSVSTSNMAEGMVILIDTRDGVGIEVRVCLEEKAMAAFEEDEDMRAFAGPKLVAPSSTLVELRAG